MEELPEDVTDDVTALLGALSSGDWSVKNRLFSKIYDQLHHLAHAAMKNERKGDLLQTTALVHEAYINLVENRDIRWRNRNHFFALAARAMRRILVSEARKRMAIKRGHGKLPISLGRREEISPGPSVSDSLPEYVVNLDKALCKLETKGSRFKRMCTLVELRFFVGLSVEETADLIGVSVPTVMRDWKFVRTWLYQELRNAQGEERETS